MKGYTVPPESELAHGDTALKPHEQLVADAVGTVIEFWGFKQNHGRVWALLYMRDKPLTAAEIKDELSLSKGAVSMITRELEQWGVIRRVRERGGSSWAFVAETDLMAMIGRVVREREALLVTRVKDDLELARREAKKSGDTSKDTLERIERLVSLSSMIESALGLFLKTARLDVKGAFHVLDDDKDPAKSSRPTKKTAR
jgi:DNA-binding transcriptional regulator GbsR (MarR family)